MAGVTVCAADQIVIGRDGVDKIIAGFPSLKNILGCSILGCSLDKIEQVILNAITQGVNSGLLLVVEERKQSATDSYRTMAAPCPRSALECRRRTRSLGFRPLNPMNGIALKTSSTSASRCALSSARAQSPQASASGLSHTVSQLSQSSSAVTLSRALPPIAHFAALGAPRIFRCAVRIEQNFGIEMFVQVYVKPLTVSTSIPLIFLTLGLRNTPFHLMLCMVCIPSSLLPLHRTTIATIMSLFLLGIGIVRTWNYRAICNNSTL